MNNTENRFSFHDSSLVDVADTLGTIVLSLEDVDLGEAQCSMIVEIRNVEKVTRDDELATTLKMETDDGEVLRLELDDKTVSLVVVWHKYQPRSHVTHKYDISGKNIELVVK